MIFILPDRRLQMLLITLTALTWIPPILGYGSLLQHAGEPALRRAVTGMLGLAVVVVLTSLLHFFAPIDALVSTAVWCLGAVLFLRRRHWLLEGFTAWEGLGASSAFIAFILLMQPPTRLYDSGLYYLQAVKWVSERRLEIGLVNLHTRLGFNSAWFVLAGALQHVLAVNEGAYFVNLLPMTFGAAGASVGLHRVFRQGVTFPDLALAATLLPIAYSTYGLGAAAPDQALSVIVPFVLVTWLRALESPDRLPSEAPAATLLSVFATMIKVSAAPLAIGSLVLAMWFRRAFASTKLLKMGILTAAAAIIWVVRSVLLSGCIVYPVAVTCFTRLRWTPELSQVDGLANWVYSWARRPGAKPDLVLGNWDWLPDWTDRMLRRSDYRFIGLLILGGMIAALFGLRAGRRSFWFTYAMALAGMAFWFFSAPDPRFAIGFLFPVAILPLAFIASLTQRSSSAISRVALGVSILVGAAYLIKANGVLEIASERASFMPTLHWPALPIAHTESRVSQAGYQANVPILTDQCWASPLPCTPQFNVHLARDWALVPLGRLDLRWRPTAWSEK